MVVSVSYSGRCIRCALACSSRKQLLIGRGQSDFIDAAPAEPYPQQHGEQDEQQSGARPYQRRFSFPHLGFHIPTSSSVKLPP